MSESHCNGKLLNSSSDEDTSVNKTLMRSMTEMVSGLSSSFMDWLYKDEGKNTEFDESSNSIPQSTNIVTATSTITRPGQSEFLLASSIRGVADNNRERIIFNSVSGQSPIASTSSSRGITDNNKEILGFNPISDQSPIASSSRRITDNNNETLVPRELDDTMNWTRKRTYEHAGAGSSTSTPVVPVRKPDYKLEYLRSTYSNHTKTKDGESTYYKAIEKRLDPRTNTITSFHPYIKSTTTITKSIPSYPGSENPRTYTYEVPWKKRRFSVFKSEENVADEVDNTVSQATQRISQVLDSFQTNLLESRMLPSQHTYKLNNTYNDVSPLKMQNNHNRNKYTGNRFQPLYVNNNIRYLQHMKLQGSTAQARQILASHSSTTLTGIPKMIDMPKERNTVIQSTAIAKDQPELVDVKKEASVQVDINPRKETCQATQVLLPISSEFTFSTPILVNNSWFKDKNDNITGTTNQTFEIESQPKVPIKLDSEKVKSSTKWRCGTCLVENDEKIYKCVCCEAKKPTTSQLPLNTTSDIKDNRTKWRCGTCLVENDDKVDKCVCCEAKKPTNTTQQPLKAISNNKSNKWRCDTCYVDNNDLVDKCVCCEAKKPSALKKLPLKVNDDKAKAKKWRCQTCFVENDDHLERCVCCEAAKFGGNVQNKPVETISRNKSEPDSLFKEIVKSQAARWECTSCFTRNDSDKDKCICCEMERPGIKKHEPAPKAFSFGTQPCAFKFGIPNNQENVSKETAKEEKPDTKKQLGTPKPISIDLTKTEATKPLPTFSFGIPSTTAATTSFTTQSVVVPKTSEETSKTVTPTIPAPTLPKEEEKKQPEPPPQLFIPAATVTVAKTTDVVNPNPTEVEPFAKLQFLNPLAVNPIAKTVSETTTSITVPSYTTSTFTMPSTGVNLTAPTSNPAPVKLPTISVSNSSFDLPTKPIAPSETAPATAEFKFTFGANPGNSNNETQKPAVNTSITNPVSASNNPLLNPNKDFISTTNEQTPFASNPLLSNTLPVTTTAFSITQPSIFGTVNSNMFTANNQDPKTHSTTNIFGVNPQSTAGPVTTATFTFGATTQSTVQSNNAFEPLKNTPPVFNIPNSSIFGGSAANEATPAPFGNAPTTNMFGNNNQTTSFLPFPSANNNNSQFPTQPSLNSNIQGTSSPFGNNGGAQEAKSPFGVASSFPLPSVPVQPAPAFGFPSTTQTTPMFGVVAPQPIASSGGFNFQLGQQSQQPSTPGVYNFGGLQSSTPQLQFNMGSFTTPGAGAANANNPMAVRRVRRAVRRTTPR